MQTNFVNNVLVIDTSASRCCVAVKAGEKFFEDNREAGRSHSEVILPAIQQLLSEAGLVLKDLDLLIFGQGPGSFTGLRIATGVVQGLGFGLNLPVVPVSVLAALAQGVYRQHHNPDLLVALLARKQEVYWGSYCLDSDQKVVVPASEECVIDISLLPRVDNRKWAGVGDGWVLREGIEQSLGIGVQGVYETARIEPEDLLTLGLWKYHRGEYLSPEEAAPAYLREKVAS
ncbi:MAG: tRNA (adenosine(37)-N6)-threonylcarbamoyltransferase complex dimerization subunit type 1 TsaB [Gammaproteobacteria bacterium]|nr:tRNA (adenosine(37)-N6)-threonylcarbamoyltransferase complex dimerization subunit type 1 TsaB [Gammaproteobacteria bacterium]